MNSDSHKDICEKLDDISSDIKQILEILKQTQTSTSRMDTHINFVESVFNRFQLPFFSSFKRLV